MNGVTSMNNSPLKAGDFLSKIIEYRPKHKLGVLLYFTRLVQKLKIDDFLSQSANHLLIDVRSPGEYGHAHIPGAYNLPLFSDDERKVVGTTYKQNSREAAIKIGLDYFGPKMRTMVEQVEQLAGNNKQVMVHCWRGGMRSGAVAWLLDLYGFKIGTLAGGYKAFRQWVLAQFGKPYQFHILGGYTGSGKTEVIEALAKRQGVAAIDLEWLAQHKGSAFGGFGKKQPSQEMFENLLALELNKHTTAVNSPIWLEDECQRIGHINIPGALWATIRQSPVFFLDIPFEVRLNHIVLEYGKYSREELVNAIIRIQKRLGGLDTKNAINYLLENNTLEAFRILLRYYDKFYGNSLFKRDNVEQLLTRLPLSAIDGKKNALHLLQLAAPK